MKAVQIFNKKCFHKDYTLMPVSRRPPQNQQFPKYRTYRKIFDTPDASVYYINRTVRSGYHQQMSSDCKLSPSSFSCCLCLEDNKCNDPDDPQTYEAYVKWVKVHRTNYLQSPVALRICANNHTCSQELYESVRKQAIEKRGLDTYVIACPVLGCAEKLMAIPNEYSTWDFLVEVCSNGHLLDYNCCLRLKASGTQACPMCRGVFRMNRTHCIPTIPITPLDGLPACRNLDGLGCILDMILSDDKVSHAYTRYENFPSMIGKIFIKPQHESSVPGIRNGVALVFVLVESTDNDNYEVLGELVTRFLEAWALVTGVMDVVAPCTPHAFEPIINCLVEILLLITQRFPPDTRLQKFVVRELQLVLKILKSANIFVRHEWMSILTAQNDVIHEVVPEVPALPDVANPDEEIARQPSQDQSVWFLIDQLSLN